MLGLAVATLATQAQAELTGTPVAGPVLVAASANGTTSVTDSALSGIQAINTQAALAAGAPALVSANAVRLWDEVIPPAPAPKPKQVNVTSTVTTTASASTTSSSGAAGVASVLSAVLGGTTTNLQQTSMKVGVASSNLHR